MMFENIRDRILLVQQDLSLSLRDLTIGSVSTSSGEESSNISNVPKTSIGQFKYDLDVNLYSGVDVVEYFQYRWMELQTQTKQNAHLAKTVARQINQIDRQMEHLKKVSHKLDSDLETLLPEIDNSLDDIENELGQTLSLLNKLNDAITKLEQETIDQSFQQRKIESNKKLNEMLIRRAEDLALYESQLYSKHERQENELLRERQAVFQQAFEEELRLYKEEGLIIEPPKTNKTIQEPKLEDISLDIDQDEVNELEKFLADD